MEQLKRTIYNVKTPDKTFSQGNNRSNFQTEHMKNKIKSVHKKKKRGNYKNIEPLSDICNDDNDDSKDHDKQPVTEGMTGVPIATFSEDDWTQPDNIYEGGNANSNTKKYSNADLVNSVYNAVDELLNKIAKLVVQLLSLSFTDYNKENIPIVKKYVCWVASIKVATLAAYNWAFMMFYKKDGERIELIDISRQRLSDAADSSKVYSLLDYLLDIPLFFPEKLQEYVVSKGPEYISKYINVRICYIILFAFLNVAFYTSASTIRTFLLDLVTANMKNPLLSFMYGSTFILYVLSFFEFKPITTVLSIAKLVAGFPASLILPIFSNIFKIFYLMMAAVPIAATLCFFYIVGFSLFGIFIINDWSLKSVFIDLFTLKTPDIFTNFADINLFFYNNKLPIKEDTTCNPLTFKDKIVNAIFRLINFIFINIRSISWLIMLIVALFDYSKNIKGATLKTVLIILHSALILYYAFNMSTNSEIYTEQDIAPELPEIKEEPVRKTFIESIKTDAETVGSLLNIDINNLPKISDVANKVYDIGSGITSQYPIIQETANNIKDKAVDIKNKAVDMKNQIDYGKATLTQDVTDLRNQFSDVNKKLDAILSSNPSQNMNTITDQLSRSGEEPTTNN